MGILTFCFIIFDNSGDVPLNFSNTCGVGIYIFLTLVVSEFGKNVTCGVDISKLSGFPVRKNDIAVPCFYDSGVIRG